MGAVFVVGAGVVAASFGTVEDAGPYGEDGSICKELSRPIYFYRILCYNKSKYITEVLYHGEYQNSR